MKSRLIQRLQILLKEQNATQYKEELYAPFGVTSSTQLTEPQLKQLISNLESGSNSEKRKLRSEILKVLTAPVKEGERQRGKRLPSMTIAELKGFKNELYTIRKTGW